MCETRPLSNNEETVVSYCVHCDTIYLWHNNLLLTFNPEEFTAFHAALNRMEFEECCLLFPDYIERLIMHSPVHNVRFTFTAPEWRQLKQAVEDALVMQQVYDCIR